MKYEFEDTDYTDSPGYTSAGSPGDYNEFDEVDECEKVDEADKRRSPSIPLSHSPATSFAESEAQLSSKAAYARTRCQKCKAWFVDLAALEERKEREKNSHCGVHDQTFSCLGIFEHARDEDHTECFVAGCDFVSASDGLEGECTGVRRHVWDKHTAKM
jgi:hypothetical protein